MTKRSENFNFLSTMEWFCKRNLLASEESWTGWGNISFSGLETGCCKYRKGELVVNLSLFLFYTNLFDESISCKISSVSALCIPKYLMAPRLEKTKRPVRPMLLIKTIKPAVKNRVRTYSGRANPTPK